MVHGLETLERLNKKSSCTNHGSRLPKAEMRLRPVKSVSPQHIKKVVVVNDESDIGYCAQAMYVDGKFVLSCSMIYACQISSFVGGEDVPFTLSQVDIEEAPYPWPETLAELLEQSTECE